MRIQKRRFFCESVDVMENGLLTKSWKRKPKNAAYQKISVLQGKFPAVRYLIMLSSQTFLLTRPVMKDSGFQFSKRF